MELLTFAGNTHALQSLIIARYNGVEIGVPPFEMGKDNKKADFMAMSPMGKVPVLKTPEGPICEAAAIARYVARMRADTNMYGSSFYEAGLVDQWIEFAKNELDLPIGMWIYPILGFISSNAANTEKAKEDVKRALAVLNTYLVKKTCTSARSSVVPAPASPALPHACAHASRSRPPDPTAGTSTLPSLAAHPSGTARRAPQI